MIIILNDYYINTIIILNDIILKKYYENRLKKKHNLIIKIVSNIKRLYLPYLYSLDNC